jgi:hypothetical protein
MARRGLALALLCLACRERPAADPVILTLGDLSVRRSEFDAHVATLRARGLEGAEKLTCCADPGCLPGGACSCSGTARAAAAGATPEQEEGAARTLLAEASGSASVDDGEVARYYEEHKAELARPEELTLREILVPTLNEARDVRRRLARDPRSFEALAQTRSRGPEASAGGLMGTFARGQLPTELEAAAFELQVGRPSEPVQTALGYHVLRVEARWRVPGPF